MDITKRLNLNNIFIFLFLVIFPFGQILRIGIIQPLDLVVGLAAVYSVVRGLEKPEIFKKHQSFLLFASVSWIFGIFIFQKIDILYGLLYLSRLFAYFYFLIYVWNFAKQKNNKELLLNSLLGISVMSTLFGWIQFFTFPDIKPFFVWGWDMHLFRLVGTFLDPTFLSLIIVFGLIISILRFIETKGKLALVIIIFLLVSLAFTYSRAGYLAFFAALTVIAGFKKVFKQLLLLAILLIVLVLILPTARNHSIELFRSFSAIARIENYQTTLKIFAKSPVFGIGYDNMCIAYQKYIGFQDFSSHACSGSDSSILFILATTGITGLMVFAFSVLKVAFSLTPGPYKPALVASVAALFVHSVFSNSMFYPWILGWMMVLLAEVYSE